VSQRPVVFLKFYTPVATEWFAPGLPPKKTLPGRAACRKPSQPITDKVSAQGPSPALRAKCNRTLEFTPMSSTSQIAQEMRPANLAALQQRLQELAASAKAGAPVGRPLVQGPVIIVRGK
jgi:hypothetical protein